jgi:hypothetical protein
MAGEMWRAIDVIREAEVEAEGAADVFDGFEFEDEGAMVG